MIKLAFSKAYEPSVEIVTEKLAFLGRTGSGKSYASKKLFELMFDAGAQALALDPVGVWAGLRIPGRSGKSFPVPVFGGLHGDVPITDKDGARVAELVFERQLSAVLDVSQMIDAEQHRFAGDFAERLFELHRGAPRAVHLFLEECQHFIPQESRDVPSRLLNRFSRLCMVGRNFGIGVSMISQRPQAVHKRCLNQAGVLFAFQLSGKHERKAVADWFDDKGSDFDIDAALPKLQRGEPLVCTPDAAPVRAKVLPIESSDSSSTPKVGESKRAVTLTPLDLQQLSSEFAERAEREEAASPEALLVKIDMLNQEISKLRQERTAKPEPPPAVLTPEERQELVLCANRCEALQNELGRLRERLDGVLQRHGAEPERFADTKPAKSSAGQRANSSQTIPSTSGLSKCAHSLLTAIAQHGDLSLYQAAIIAGYAPKSGGVAAASGELRAGGYTEGGNAQLSITEKGRTATADAPKLPKGKKLAELWIGKLARCEGMLLSEVLAVYPSKISLKDAATRAGYAPASGGVAAAAGKLRTLELVHGGNAGMTADRRLV